MPERLTAFSEGVFAVLITGLVPELRPPGVPTYSELLHVGNSPHSHFVKKCRVADIAGVAVALDGAPLNEL